MRNALVKLYEICTKILYENLNTDINDFSLLNLVTYLSNVDTTATVTTGTTTTTASPEPLGIHIVSLNHEIFKRIIVFELTEMNYRFRSSR